MPLGELDRDGERVGGILTLSAEDSERLEAVLVPLGAQDVLE